MMEYKRVFVRMSYKATTPLLLLFLSRQRHLRKTFPDSRITRRRLQRKNFISPDGFAMLMVNGAGSPPHELVNPSNFAVSFLPME